MYQRSLFIFRRDLRLIDNTALIAALKSSKQVLIAFIFDPQQISNKNKYLSHNAIQFMLESLLELSHEIKQKGGKIYFFKGEPDQIVHKLFSEAQIEAIFTNRDYTPFSNKRDQKISSFCNQHDIAFQQYDDYLLNNPDLIKNKSNSIYKIFTAFYKRCITEQVEQPVPRTKLTAKNIYRNSISFSVPFSEIAKELIPKNNPDAEVHGGRIAGHRILNHLKNFKSYGTEKDFPSIATTHLSAHLKFGTISIREAFYEIIKSLGSHHPLLRQLYWRDFFTYIAYHKPTVFGSAFNPKYNHIKWESNNSYFKLWCEGKTGFPIVDAGMRQLNQTGFMHNRVRMITASFLVKDLHIDWQKGEQYFAKNLVDYDPAVNNGNWQWVASTGCDAQPYFRIFNPWLQQKKFDPECIYIKQWLPELKNISPKIIHNWYKKNDISLDYPKPIIEHSIEAKKAIKMY